MIVWTDPEEIEISVTLYKVLVSLLLNIIYYIYFLTNVYSML